MGQTNNRLGQKERESARALHSSVPNVIRFVTKTRHSMFDTHAHTRIRASSFDTDSSNDGATMPRKLLDHVFIYNRFSLSFCRRERKHIPHAIVILCAQRTKLEEKWFFSCTLELFSFSLIQYLVHILMCTHYFHRTPTKRNSLSLSVSLVRDVSRDVV